MSPSDTIVVTGSLAIKLLAIERDVVCAFLITVDLKNAFSTTSLVQLSDVPLIVL
jgi:hypothetical protein